MIAIPNMKKPKSCGECDLWSNCFYPKNPYTEQDDYIASDCSLIEIDDIQYKAFLEFNEKLMKKLEEHFLYGERRTDEYTD